MPRQGRLVAPHVALHVRQRGHNGVDCFREDVDRLVYLTVLNEVLRKYGCALHAYCLMTNHVHLLLTPSTPHSCAGLMRDLGQRYVQYFNRRYARRGTLWEGRFRSCLVDSADYVLACYRYIELNPVRAGMAEAAPAYGWSSYHGNVGAIDNKLLTPHPEFAALSQTPAVRYEQYRKLVADGDRPEFLVAVRDATSGGFALVGDSLKAELARATGRHLERRTAGRPAAATAMTVEETSLELGLCPRFK